MVLVALAGKSKGVKEAVGTQYPKNGILCLAARCPVVASHSHFPCTWDPRERDQIFTKSPGKKHGGWWDSDWPDLPPVALHEAITEARCVEYSAGTVLTDPSGPSPGGHLWGQVLGG